MNNFYTADGSSHANTEPPAMPNLPVAEKEKLVVEIAAPVPTSSLVSTSHEKADVKSTSKSQNIRIEANGADCVFEVNDDGYNIYVNAKDNNEVTKADVPGSNSTFDWYEIIKICLLAALVITLIRKPKKVKEADYME